MAPTPLKRSTSTTPVSAPAPQPKKLKLEPLAPPFVASLPADDHHIAPPAPLPASSTVPATPDLTAPPVSYPMDFAAFTDLPTDFAPPAGDTDPPPELSPPAFDDSLFEHVPSIVPVPDLDAYRAHHLQQTPHPHSLHAQTSTLANTGLPSHIIITTPRSVIPTPPPPPPPPPATSTGVVMPSVPPPSLTRTQAQTHGLARPSDGVAVGVARVSSAGRGRTRGGNPPSSPLSAGSAKPASSDSTSPTPPASTRSEQDVHQKRQADRAARNRESSRRAREKAKNRFRTLERDNLSLRETVRRLGLQNDYLHAQYERMAAVQQNCHVCRFNSSSTASRLPQQRSVTVQPSHVPGRPR